MARVKRGVTAHAKHKKVLEQAKGFYGRRKNTIRTAKAAVDKAGQYAYRDRKVRKRQFRSLWIQRINAAARVEGMTYARFIHGLDLAGIEMIKIGAIEGEANAHGGGKLLEQPRPGHFQHRCPHQCGRRHRQIA